MRKWFLYFTISASILACRSNPDHKIIPEKQLVPLLVDLHIADAIALNHTINEIYGGLDSALLYGSILESHGYTKEQMAYSMKYYSGEYEKMTEIFDEVFSELSLRSEEVKERYNSTTSSRSFLVWRHNNRTIKVKGDTINYLPPFEIDIDTIGTFIISAEIMLNTIDESINPRIQAYFYTQKNARADNHLYFDEVPITKSNNFREYTLIQEMPDSTLTGLRIILPLQDNQDSSFLKRMEIRNLRVALISDKKDRPGIE